MSPPPTKKPRSSKRDTRKRKTTPTTNNKDKQLANPSTQKSLTEWTHTRRANRKTVASEKESILPEGNISNQINI